MRSLKELLAGTSGIAQVAREYADGVQAGKIDGNDCTISISENVRVGASKTRSGAVDVVIQDNHDSLDITGDEARRLFAVLYGFAVAEFDEPLETGEPQPSPAADDLKAALALLRTATYMLATEPDSFDLQRLGAEADALLAKYPEEPK